MIQFTCLLLFSSVLEVHLVELLEHFHYWEISEEKASTLQTELARRAAGSVSAEQLCCGCLYIT